MFDIGWSELLVIAVVAIIVVGPKDLPRLMRTFGAYAGKLRRMAADFQHQFEDAMREAEIEEVRKAMESVREGASAIDLSAPIDRPVMLPKPATAAPTPAPKPKRAKTKAPPRAKPATVKAKAVRAKTKAPPRAKPRKPRKDKT